MNHASSITFGLTVNNLPPTLTVDQSSVTVGEGQTAVNSGTWWDVPADVREGSFGFAPARTFSSGGSSPIPAAVADFNRDGNLDLAVGNYWSNTVGVLLGDGNGGFSGPTTFPTGDSSPVFVQVGDFNGDGSRDLAVAHHNSDTVGVLLGDGSGGFLAPTLYPSGGNGPHSIAMGDFNGDGKLDLAVANQHSNTVGVLLGDGSGGFAPASTFSCGGSDPTSVAVGDFNGDGISDDLAVANYGSNTVGVLLNNGSGGFLPVRTFSSGGNVPFFVSAGDFNGDGIIVTFERPEHGRHALIYRGLARRRHDPGLGSPAGATAWRTQLHGAAHVSGRRPKRYFFRSLPNRRESHGYGWRLWECFHQRDRQQPPADDRLGQP